MSHSTALVVSSSYNNNNNNVTNNNNNNMLINYPYDSLSYIDNELSDPNLKSEVEQLIHEEMKNSNKTPQQYLEERLIELGIPIMDTNERYEAKSEILEETMKELSENQGKFNTNPQSIRNKLLTKLQAQIAHSVDKNDANALRLSIENLFHCESTLEDMKNNGPNQWKLANSQAEAIKTHYQSLLTNQQSSIDSINRKRKTDQLLIQPKLQQSESEFGLLIGKNLEIQLANIQIQENIKRLKKQAEIKGIDISDEIAELRKFFKDYDLENESENQTTNNNNNEAETKDNNSNHISTSDAMQDT